MAKSLHLGKMKSSELAEWFGLSSTKYYSNHRKEKLEELKDYADFDEIYGGVIINEIYLDTYSKKIEDDKLYDNEIRARENHITSLTGMANGLVQYNDNFKNDKVETIKRRLKKAGDRAYGNTRDKESIGPYGRRYYIWAIKLDNYGNYREFTPEEKATWELLKEKYQNAIGERAEEQAMLNYAYQHGEMSKDEYCYRSSENSFFDKVIQEFYLIEKQRVALSTKHVLIEEITDWEEKEIIAQEGEFSF